MRLNPRSDNPGTGIVKSKKHQPGVSLWRGVCHSEEVSFELASETSDCLLWSNALWEFLIIFNIADTLKIIVNQDLSIWNNKKEF